MSIYIVLNNISSFLELSRFADAAEDSKGTTAADSLEEAGRNTSAGVQTIIAAEPPASIPAEVDDSLENPISAIDCGKTAAVSVQQVSPTVEVNTENSILAAEEQNPKIGAENVGQADIYEKFHSLLKKYELSLQFRYDSTDVFNNIREIEHSRNTDKLIERNLSKQRTVQREDFERRLQEKQAESFREHLKQKKTSASDTK